MLPISEQALILIRQHAPDFREAVLEAKKKARERKRGAYVAIKLERFDDDPFLLYACLWYAVFEDVEVRVLTR